MILYSDRDDHYSQRVRIVLAEKDITAEIHEAKPEETPEDILSISPYHKLPILVDRDLAIHDPFSNDGIFRRKVSTSAIASCISGGKGEQ
jgi:glutathione S-transferase